MIEAARNAVVMGSFTAAAAMAAHSRYAAWAVPVLCAGALGTAFAIGCLDTRWVLDSLGHDVPWVVGAGLIAWVALGASGVVRAGAWLPAVAVTVVAGDVLAAAGVALAVEDRRRRAALVLACSGASAAGRVSGATTTLLGWPGAEVAVVALLLSLVGLLPLGAPAAARSPALSFHRPSTRAMVRPAIVALGAALGAWFLALGGAADVAAYHLEKLPMDFPGQASLWVGGVGAAMGALLDEGFVAMAGREVLLDALAVRGSWARDALVLGASVGGGVPLLWITRSSWAVGFPLWVVQVGVALAWLWTRTAV
jgi:hypothetical protein